MADTKIPVKKLWSFCLAWYRQPKKSQCKPVCNPGTK